jgi:RimJ/RimL family protein N-acetyltransferase
MWGKGYATEASIASLKDALERRGISRVLSYTDINNARSQAVMKRIGLVRDENLDFTHDYGLGGVWFGLVWRSTDQSL